MDDRELLDRFGELREGREEAFAALYADMKKPVYTVILRIVGDPPLAEDLLQEVFLRLLASPPAPSLRHPRAWIFRVARNLAIDSVRKPKTEALPEEQADPAQPLEACADRLDIEAALSRLSLAEREIVVLHLNGDLPFREIAGILEQPLGTVLWRYRQAVGKLRIILSGGDDR